MKVEGLVKGDDSDIGQVLVAEGEQHVLGQRACCRGHGGQYEMGPSVE